MTPSIPSSSHSGTSQVLSEQEIEFLFTLAERCGALAAQMRESVKITEKSDPGDLVTSADLALSDILLHELGKRFPSDLLISEEGSVEELTRQRNSRTWYLDPIDGTDNYVSNDGQYAVMIGLLLDGKPHFGCVSAPAQGVTFFGGPAYGCWKRKQGQKAQKVGSKYDTDMGSPVRLMIGYRDRKRNKWVEQLPEIKLVSAGSVGLKVAKILDDEADIFVHLSGKLKYWDTAGPAAIALAAGLEAASLLDEQLDFPSGQFRHTGAVILGLPGSSNWAREKLGPNVLVEE